MEMLILENCHFDFSRFSSRVLNYHLLKIMYVTLYLLRVHITNVKYNSIYEQMYNMLSLLSSEK